MNFLSDKVNVADDNAVDFHYCLVLNFYLYSREDSSTNRSPCWKRDSINTLAGSPLLYFYNCVVTNDIRQSRSSHTWNSLSFYFVALVNRPDVSIDIHLFVVTTVQKLHLTSLY